MLPKHSSVLLVALNLGLALLVHSAPAPGSPHDSDRAAYDYVGHYPFAPNCGWSIYCYRVLVPAALEHVPFDGDRRWRGLQILGTAAAGTVLALMTFKELGGLRAAVFVTVVTQTSYGFAFTAYDPYTPDPFVFAVAAAIAWCWMANRWWITWILGTVGVFAKETIALISASCVVASFARVRPNRYAWVVSGMAVGISLIGFHIVMDTCCGWTMSNNPAAQFAHGSWLALWWRNNPSLVRKMYWLFAPFGFAWAFALRGLQTADRRLCDLTLGSILPILALCYVQTPERALSNAFFVVAPLAGVFLARVPRSVSTLAVVFNGMLTVKLGSSSPWLPPSRFTLVPAALCAAWALWAHEK